MPLAEQLCCSMGEEIMAKFGKDTSAQDAKRQKTEGGRGYWGKDGKYQELFDEIVKEHVPALGIPKTGGLCAKLVFAVLKLQHELFNNDFWNGMDDFVPNMDAESYRTSNFSWNYAHMLGFLYYHGSESAREIIEYYQAGVDIDNLDDSSSEEDVEEL